MSDQNNEPRQEHVEVLKQVSKFNEITFTQMIRYAPKEKMFNIDETLEAMRLVAEPLEAEVGNEMNCLNCNSPVKGRAGKKYCSLKCKNEYHNNLKPSHTMEDTHTNITVRVPINLKRKLEVLADTDGKKLAAFLRILLSETTKHIELPGPAETVAEKQERIARLPKITSAAYKPAYAKNASVQVTDKDYSGQIDPEALRPNSDTPWMNKFID